MVLKEGRDKVACFCLLIFSSSMDWSPKNACSALSSSSKAVIVVFLVLLVGGFFSAQWIDTSSFGGSSSSSSSSTSLFTSIFSSTHHRQSIITVPSSKQKPYAPLTCPLPNNTCPSLNHTLVPLIPTPTTTPPPSCPSFFRWIYEDLRPWSATGISRDMVEAAQNRANFRLVVVGGRAYLDKYHGAFQTRDVFTLWGFLQLLRQYPGRVPDFDLMFNLDDPPAVRASERAPGGAPPPLFRYCKDDSTVDIVFPDWSFWGWPEVNIKPWVVLLEELKKGNERVKWKRREPHAYWKGNPWVAGTRQDLMKCNVSKTNDWNARLYSQDWVQETRAGFKSSDLASQCTHRYKIYIEGRAWSVSEKYILACNSPTLFVNTGFRDFFTRGLMPGQHYLPIRSDDKCRSIKSAVDWGNSHQKKAQVIGRAGSRFIQEELKMDYVYDYMLHLLSEYSKLLSYRPTVPEGAVELCSESVACPRVGREREYMEASTVKAPRDAEPCAIPPPFSPGELQEFLRSKASAVAEVERWN